MTAAQHARCGAGDLVAAVRASLDDALERGAGAVVAVSGGPDSAALLGLVVRARADLGVVAVHVRHGLRDDAADARAAQAVASRCGVRLVERRAVVAAGRGPEDAARAARYRELEAAAGAVEATAIVVGHTADDQAETVLLRLARGTGTSGLGGMAAVSRRGTVLLVRPLLGLRRAAVRTWASAEGVPSVEDPTNGDPAQRRARARHELIPALARLAPADGTDVVGAICRLARCAAADDRALWELADAHLAGATSWGPGASVPWPPRGAPEAVAARVVRGLLACVRGTSTGAAADEAATRRILDLEVGGALDAPGGVWVTRGATALAAVPRDALALRPRALPDHGAVDVPELRATVRVDVDAAARGPQRSPCASASPPRADGLPRLPWSAVVPVHPEDRLVLRGPRPGDRLSTPAGRRRLADLLRAWPRALRGLAPVVATADGDVRWAAGLVADGPEGAHRRRLTLEPTGTPSDRPVPEGAPAP